MIYLNVDLTREGSQLSGKLEAVKVLIAELHTDEG